jgi:hypothetical protein
MKIKRSYISQIRNARYAVRPASASGASDTSHPAAGRRAGVEYRPSPRLLLPAFRRSALHAVLPQTKVQKTSASIPAPLGATTIVAFGVGTSAETGGAAVGEPRLAAARRRGPRHPLLSSGAPHHPPLCERFPAESGADTSTSRRPSQLQTPRNVAVSSADPPLVRPSMSSPAAEEETAVAKAMIQETAAAGAAKGGAACDHNPAARLGIDSASDSALLRGRLSSPGRLDANSSAAGAYTRSLQSST